MKFIDTASNTEHRFGIGREAESGRHYLSIPVANRLCDYEEYYEIPGQAHDAYPDNLPDLVEFAEQCRARRNDHLLLLQPGTDRGVAR